MRVVHVAAEVADAATGGVAILRMCEALVAGGLDTELAAFADAADRQRHPYVRAFTPDFRFGSLTFSRGFTRWLDEAARSGYADVIHTHGLWRMPGIYAAHAARAGGRKLLVSPHGMLARDALRQRAGQKRMFWTLAEKQALRTAACFHATSRREFEDIRGQGFRQPVCLLPHGVDLPAVQSTPREPMVLFLGRIHEQKGLDTLLPAWRAVESRYPDWSLRIVGPSKPGHLARFERLATELQLNRVAFSGPVRGEDKSDLLRRASLLVLPSRFESFGLVVAEALAAGIPVVVSDRTPWGDVEAQGAGWCVPLGEEPWTEALEAALGAGPERLSAMGVAGRAWMRRDFSWQDVAAKLIATYRWMNGEAERPCWVLD